MFEHVEPLIDAALATLRAGLNDIIDVINARHSDFPIDHINLDAYSPGGRVKPAVFWPHVEISAADSYLSDPAIQQVAWNRSETTIVCVAWCRHVDDEVLYRSVMRYGQALLQIVSTNNTFGENARVERARVGYRRNLEADESEQLVARVVVIVQVVVDDESP